MATTYSALRPSPFDFAQGYGIENNTHHRALVIPAKAGIHIFVHWTPPFDFAQGYGVLRTGKR